MKLTAQDILVSGANRGIGQSIVRSLLKRDTGTIYATAREPSQLRTLIEESGGRVKPLQLDITDPESVRRAASAADTVSLVINNAGVFASGNVFEAELDAVRQDLEVNYVGLLNMIRGFTPVIRGVGGGAFANVLSVVSLANMPMGGGYSASKAAAFSLTQAVRAELVPQGIRVHNIYPGPVDTDMTAELDFDKATPESVAEAILTGIEQGEDDIFPDEMARQVGETWRRDPKAVEAQFAQMGATAGS